MELEVFALTLLGFLHTANSFSGNFKYVEGKDSLLDFDEEDPFYESVSKPEEISPLELKRLKLRRPRDTVHGAFTLNYDAALGIGTKIPIVENKMFILNAGGFDDEMTKERRRISRGLDHRHFYKAETPFDVRNPFYDSKTHSLNIIATPYTRSKWEPNFSRTVLD